MAITVRKWGRSSPFPTQPYLDSVWSTTGAETVPPYTGNPWTLLAFRYEAYVAVHVQAGAGLNPLWWSTAQVRLASRHTPDSIRPSMARDDESEEVLSMQLLVPTLYGEDSGTTDYTVVWRQTEPVNVLTRRRGTPALVPVVWTFVWFESGDGVFSMSGPPVYTTVNQQSSSLWGQ